MSDKWDGWTCIPGRICGGAEMMRKADDKIERLTSDHKANELLWWDEKGALEDQVSALQARVDALEAVRVHAAHLLASGGEEAVYRLKEALAATEQGVKYTRCPNAQDGQHKWREDIGKNAGKPKCCVYCSRLAVDLLAAAEQEGDPYADLECNVEDNCGLCDTIVAERLAATEQEGE